MSSVAVGKPSFTSLLTYTEWYGHCNSDECSCHKVLNTGYMRSKANYFSVTISKTI